MATQRIGLIRLGAGQLPTCIVVGEVELPGHWDERPEYVTILTAKALPLGGDLVKAKAEFIKAMGAAYAKAVANGQAWNIRWTARDTPEPITLCDLTCDPAARDLLPWSGGTWVIRGGRTQSIDAGPDKIIGRLNLLSDLKLRLSRKRVRARLDNDTDTQALRNALSEAAERPVTTDSVDSGIDLIDISSSEALAVTTALLVREALSVIPMDGGDRMDYSQLIVG